MLVLVVIVLILAVVALYPVVHDLLRRRHSTAPAYVEGLQFILDGRDAEALAKLKETVAKNPNNIDAYIRLGDILFRQGETERGVKVHENLALRHNLAPADEEKVLRALTRDYLAGGRKLKAVSSLEELVHLAPRDTRSIQQLFRLYLETASWEKCEALLRGLKRQPHDRKAAAALFAELGRAYSRTKPGAADDWFDEALRLDGESIVARVYLGDHLMSRHDTEGAIRNWTEVIELAPEKNALVRERLEAAFYESGRYDEITRVYERLLKANPDDEGLAVALAEIYQKREELPKAVRVLERFTRNEVRPASGAALAATLLRQGETERAARVLDEVSARLQSDRPEPRRVT